jgi:hypothetical protein
MRSTQMPQTQHMQMQRQMQRQVQRQVQPSDQGGEAVRHAGLHNGAAAEARGGVSGGVTLAMLQARQDQLQQRQVPLVIHPDHSTTAACLPLMTRSAPRARLGLCCVPMPLLAAPRAPWPPLASQSK